MTAPVKTIPPLREGDRMDADEFMRRYKAMPAGTRAELIEGVVNMPPPISGDDHGFPHGDLAYPLLIYQRHTVGVRLGITPTVRLGGADAPEPDLILMVLLGGGARVVGGYITGSPELAVEVAASSASIDRNAKFRAYQAAGIREYILWQTERRLIEWFVLDCGRYVELAPAPDGTLRSQAFPGLWLDPAALLANDAARVEAVVRMGLAAPEHAAFVAEMNRRLSQPGP
jgi:Uma2 family endonuclease